MPKKTDALDNYKRRQKAVDEMQVEELRRQSAKDKEHDEELARQRSADKSHDEKISSLEKDVEQLKNEPKGSSDKDIKQDKTINDLKASLTAESVKVKALYSSLEAETAKIAELYDEVYSLKQKNISQAYTDKVQDIKASSIEAKLAENKLNDDKQSADISRNRSSIDSQLKYIESVDKKLKDNSRGDLITRIIAIASLAGVIVLAVLQLVK